MNKSMKSYSHYINGSYISSSHSTKGKARHLDHSPIDYQYSYIQHDDPSDQELVEAALMGADESFQQVLQGFFPLEERIAFLKQLYREFEKSQDSIAAVLSYEIKKPIQLAKGELARALKTLEASLEAAESFFQTKKNTLIDQSLLSSSIIRQGLGPILCLTPFNFPINLALHKIAPAILSGCPVILKSSPKSVLSTACLIDQIHAAKLPAGLLSFIHCDNETISKILVDPRIKHVSFTGSAKVGWQLAQKTTRPITLELGGNAPVYIDETANLEKAAQELCVGAFAYAGQVCISVQNIYIHKKVYPQMRALLLEELEKLPTGSIDNAEVVCSSLVDEDNFHRVQKLLEEEKSQKALIHQQKNPHKIENYIAPAFIENASTRFFQEEIFAPLATLSEIESFEEWIEQVNQQENRLQCAIYTQNLEHQKKFSLLDFGGIIVNTPSQKRLDPMPYGGQGNSGLGREGPLYALESMNTWKTILEY